MTPPSSPEQRKDRYSLSGLLLLAVLALIALHFPHLRSCARAMILSRAGTAHSLLTQLELATKAYELDFGEYPPGDGSGTAGLRPCLAGSRRPKCSYFVFPREELDPGGQLANPVDPGKIVHDRRPGFHRRASFDLWCKDADGRPDGINTWGGRPEKPGEGGGKEAGEGLPPSRGGGSAPPDLISLGMVQFLGSRPPFPP